MTHKGSLAIDLAIKAGLFSDPVRGLEGCRPAARVAVLEHRLFANGREVTHTETRLPKGEHEMLLVEHVFTEGVISVHHKRGKVTA